MSQQRQYQSAAQFGDTTYTKIFVGGLAWETQRDTMRSYFEQFGEILEAVVIADKSTGRSKGYGFVTFRDPDSAMRACQDPSPVIDGRRANCNLASLGAQKNRPPTPPNVMENYRPRSWPVAPANYRQSSPRIPYPYSPYGRYSGYPQNMHSMNYYNAISGQQFSSPYAASAAAAAATPSGSPGVYYNYYPYYAQFGQSGIHYPQAVQYPYLPQHSHGAGGSFSVPASGTTIIGSSGGDRGTVSDQKSSA